MTKPITISALLAALLTASPALAQVSAQQPRDADAPNFRLQLLPEISSSERSPGSAMPETGLFEGSGPGIGITSRSYRADDGSSAIRRGMVGSVAVAEGLSAGIGLFSVTHDNQKEPEFRRNWQAKNVGPRNRKVAAVGMSLRF